MDNGARTSWRTFRVASFRTAPALFRLRTRIVFAPAARPLIVADHGSVPVALVHALVPLAFSTRTCTLAATGLPEVVPLTLREDCSTSAPPTGDLIESCGPETGAERT